jgi:hypothetical protein
MGVIIPFALRPSNAARFEAIGGEAHHATMLMFPPVQVRDIRNIWGMTVEGPPRAVPDGIAFSDGKPRRAEASRAKASSGTKASGAKLPSAKLPSAKVVSVKSASAKRKPARSPK